MRWLVAAMAVLWLALPAPTWAQDQVIGPPVMPEPTDAVGQAVGATLKSAWGGAQIPFDDQVGLWDSIVAFLNMGISSKDNWLTVAQRLGLIEGTPIVTHGGGGAENGDWCVDMKYVRDIAGNFIVPGVKYRMPKAYERPQDVWTTLVLGKGYNTGEVLGAFAIANWALNANRTGSMRYTGVYWQPRSGNVLSIVATRPAYWDGTKIVAMDTKILQVSLNTVAWYPEYTGGPPASWKAADSVCTGGAGVDHWKGPCVAPPNDWNIPSEGVVSAVNMPVWMKAGAGDLGLCPLDKEFIRQVAEKAWAAAAQQPGYTGPPAQHIEPEHVKNGTTKPTVNDLQNLTKPTTPPEGTTPDPEPTTTPTDTPTTGPDWTNPGTSAPNPQTPTAQSIVDKAFDWGFPAIQINLGSSTCPIYTADFFGHTLTLDSHCPFIAQNRAIISAMMILLFTIAAGIIVLRA